MKRIVNLLLAVVMACATLNFVACNEDKIFKGNYTTASAEQQTQILGDTKKASNDDVYSTDGYLIFFEYEEEDDGKVSKMKYEAKTKIKDGKASASIEVLVKGEGYDFQGKTYYHNGYLYKDIEGSSTIVGQTSINGKYKKEMNFNIENVISSSTLVGVGAMGDVDLMSVAGAIETENYYFGICSTEEYYKVKITYEEQDEEIEAFFVYSKDYKLVAMKVKLDSNDTDMEIKITPYSGRVATPKNPDGEEWKTSILGGLI